MTLFVYGSYTRGVIFIYIIVYFFIAGINVECMKFITGLRQFFT